VKERVTDLKITHKGESHAACDELDEVMTS
jgi:hypothetical protein